MPEEEESTQDATTEETTEEESSEETTEEETPQITLDNLDEAINSALAPMKEKLDSFEPTEETPKEEGEKQYTSVNEMRDDIKRMVMEGIKKDDDTASAQEERDIARINQSYDKEISDLRRGGEKITPKVEKEVFQLIVDTGISTFTKAHEIYTKINPKKSDETSKEKSRKVSKGRSKDTSGPTRIARPGMSAQDVAGKIIARMENEE